MSFQDIIDEFPLKKGSGDRFRHDCSQSEWIKDLVSDKPELKSGACYNLCYWFANLRLLQDPNSFKEFIDEYSLTMAIRNQGFENFKVKSNDLRIDGYFPNIIERDFGTKFCLFRYNKTLANNLEIIDAILAARAVSMLVLRPKVHGEGHAIAFDTRTSITFFDPNYGWFEDLSSPVGAAYFRDWYHRWYHASFYKKLFEHGRRQLVVW